MSDKKSVQKETRFGKQSISVALIVFAVAVFSFVFCTPNIVLKLLGSGDRAACLIFSPFVLAVIANYAGACLAANTRRWLATERGIKGFSLWRLYALFLVPGGLLSAVMIAVWSEADMGGTLGVLLAFLLAYVLFAYANDNRIRDLAAVRRRVIREQSGSA